MFRGCDRARLPLPFDSTLMVTLFPTLLCCGPSSASGFAVSQLLGLAASLVEADPDLGADRDLEADPDRKGAEPPAPLLP